MRRLLADFILESDLCLPKESPPIDVHDRQQNWTLTLSNLESVPEATSARLAGRLAFDHAEGMDTAREAANQKLASALNALVYATNRRFAVVELRKILDMTPGKVERDALFFHTSPVGDCMEPGLTSEFTESASRLLGMHSADAAQATAMRWYRLGIGEGNFEQQFNYFWFALEIVAQALKTTEKRHSECPQCHGRLYCEACKTYPMHRPYPGEAIKGLIERVHPEHANEVFETLQKVRHTLMHGDRIESIAAALPCSPQQAVDKLARVTWSAIGVMFDQPDPKEGKDFVLGGPDTVVRGSMIASVHMITTLLPGADVDHPQLEDFAQPEFTMEYIAREGEDESSQSAG
jgi:hypothetical protein